MALSLIAYPKVIYIQSTEPTNKTQGLLWVDSDDNKLYVSDGTNYNTVLGQITDSMCVAEMTPSDDLLFSDDADGYATTSATYEMTRQIATVTDTAGNTSTLRIKFDFVNVGAGTTNARIYRNRSGTPTAVGTEQTEAVADTWSGDLSEDIAGWEDGDIIEMWMKTTIGSGRSRNRRIYGKGDFTPLTTVTFA